jgi:hypothetical protein
MAPQKSKKTSRFWLFAPFVVLALLTGGYFLFWQWTADFILTNLKSAGLNAATTQRSGFPARLSFVLSEPTYRDPSLEWRTTELRLDLMPFSRQQAVLKADGTHRLTLSTGAVMIDHALNTASARVDTEGLARVDVVLAKPVFSGQLGRVNLNMASQASEIHLRRSPNNAHIANIAVTNKAIRMGRQTALDILDLEAAAPMSWFMSPGQWAKDLRAGTRIDITNLHVSRQGLSIQGDGAIGADRNDKLVGAIKLNVNDLSLFLDLLRELNVIDGKSRKQIELVQGISGLFKALTGDQKTVKLKLDLEFRDGMSYLAKIPLGPAPRLPLPLRGS